MTNWKQWVGIIGVIVAIVGVSLGLYYHISGLNQKTTELELENTELKNKVYVLEKYTDLVVKLVSEGKATIKDVAFFLPEEEIEKVSEKVSSGVPFPVNVDTYFYPSGWMGDGEYGERYITFTRSIDYIKITYTPGPERWAGIYWQYPDSNWGKQPGRSLIGARKLTFWAKGETGNEIVEFKTGGIRGRKYEDSFEKSLGRIKLSQSWKQYEIDLADLDLSNVIGAFTWVASRDANPDGLTFHLKDIYFEE